MLLVGDCEGTAVQIKGVVARIRIRSACNRHICVYKGEKIGFVLGIDANIFKREACITIKIMCSENRNGSIAEKDDGRILDRSTI